MLPAGVGPEPGLVVAAVVHESLELGVAHRVAADLVLGQLHLVLRYLPLYDLAL